MRPSRLDSLAWEQALSGSASANLPARVQHELACLPDKLLQQVVSTYVSAKKLNHSSRTSQDHFLLGLPLHLTLGAYLQVHKTPFCIVAGLIRHLSAAAPLFGSETPQASLNYGHSKLS